jgi:hypothetical protein
MQSTRPQRFRFRYIDREVHRGRYPNCPQRGETLGVSTRTIQCDIERMKERDWMLEHEIQFRTDGGIDLTVRLEDADAIVRWVLQWGFGAEIMPPPWVRRRPREQLERIRERYEPHPPRAMRSRRKGQGIGRVLKPPSPAKKQA